MKTKRINRILFFILLIILILCGCSTKTDYSTAESSELVSNTTTATATKPPATTTPTATPTKTSEPTPTPTNPPPEPVPLTEMNIHNIQMITTTEFFLLGTLSDAAWSPDGETLIVTTDRDLQVVDAENLDILQSLQGYTFVHFLDDGNLLLKNAQDSLEILDMQVFELNPISSEIPFDVYMSTVSYDGKTIADISIDNKVILINIETGETTEFDYYPEEYASIDPRAVTFSPDGNHLYIARSTYPFSDVLVFDLEKQQLLSQNIELRDLPTFSPDGKRLVFRTKYISLYTSTLGPWYDLSSSFSSSKYFSAISYSFIQDSSRIGILYGDATRTEATIVVYNTNNGSVEGSIKGIPGTSFDVGFSPDGSQFFTLSDEGTIQIWGASDSALLLTSQAYRPETNVAVSPDGSLFAYYTNATVRIVSSSDGELVTEFADPYHSIRKNVSFQGNDNIAIYNYGHGKSRIDTYEIATWEWIRNYPEVGSCVFNGSGNTMICTGGDFELYDSETGKALIKIRPERSYYFAVSDDGAYTAFCNTSSETVFLWDTQKGTQIEFLRMNNQPVCSSLDFSADGQYLISSIGAVWQIPSGDLVLGIPSQGGGIIDISTNNEFVLIYPFVYSLHDGSLLAEINPTGERIINAWFHPNGYDLILLSSNTIQFWGVLE